MDWPRKRSPGNNRSGAGGAIHEAGIARNILQIIEQALPEKNRTKVRKVVLEVGQFSGVEVHALDMAFSAFRPGSVLEDAEIEYLKPPLLLYCIGCQMEYAGDQEDLRCPICDGEQYRVLQGRELVVKSIAVED